MGMNAGQERRDLVFETLDDAVAEAERLASGEVRTTGKHSFGQILEHLAKTHDMATGKLPPPPLPLVMRLLMPFMRGMIFSRPVKPGFKLPKAAEAYFWPEGHVDVADALRHLKESVENYNINGPLEVHPVFGKATREQNLSLNCKHCAMHLSFVHRV